MAVIHKWEELDIKKLFSVLEPSNNYDLLGDFEKNPYDFLVNLSREMLQSKYFSMSIFQRINGWEVSFQHTIVTHRGYSYTGIDLKFVALVAAVMTRGVKLRDFFDEKPVK